jgi:signal transduction histidine kinase
MRLSLRYQLLLPMLVLLLGVTGLGAWAAVHSVRQAVRQQIEAQLTQVARTVSEATFPFTERVLVQLKELTGAEYLLIAADGRRQFTLAAPVSDQELESIPGGDRQDIQLGGNIHLAGQNYLTAKIHLRRANAAAPDLLFIFYPEWRWRDALWRALEPMVFLGVLGSLLAAGLAVFVADWLARRIGRLVAQTRLIAQGQFRPLALPAWNDEIRDLAGSVNAMAEQLARWQEAVHKTERLRLLAQVSGGLAHQLRNGIAGARLAVQVHVRSCTAGAEREALDMALRQLALMEAQVQRLLQAGREEPPALKPCSLTQVLEETIALMRPQCQHRHIELRAKLPKSAVDVLADAGQLGNLFINVLGNAAEAIGANGWIEVRARIVSAAAETVEAAPGPIWHVVEVVDSGPGPPPEVADRIFEEFVTSKSEGVGLGLAVARQVATAHGGRIDWRRDNGQTCFSIWLPVIESVS